MNAPKERGDAFIVVAVADPVLHPEATHVAAATTRAVVDFNDPSQAAELRRYAARAAAVLVDTEFAEALAGTRLAASVLFVTSDRTPMDWEAALRCHADEAFILPAQSAEALTRLSEVGDPGTPANAPQAAATCVAVTATAGGAGTSTFAAALARVAAGGQLGPVTLLDADPHSGGIDLLLGIEDVPGGRWPDLELNEDSSGLIDAQDLRAALPATADDIAVLSAARSTIDDPFLLSPEQTGRVVASLSSSAGVVVVDLSVAADAMPCDLVVVIVPAEVRAAAAGARLVRRLRSTKTKYVVVVRRRAWSGLETDDLTRVLGTEPIAEITTAGSLPRDSEIAGLPRRLPATLRGAAEAVLAEVGATGGRR